MKRLSDIMNKYPNSVDGILIKDIKSIHHVYPINSFVRITGKCDKSAYIEAYKCHNLYYGWLYNSCDKRYYCHVLRANEFKFYSNIL